MFSTDPNPRVGCVLVRGGRIVGEGWHEHAGEAHAEIKALEVAADQAAGSTAYVTLEPCCHFGRTPPCVDALIKAGVGKVVYAMDDPDPRVAGKGAERLRGAGIEVVAGVLADRVAALNPGFISRWRRQRPYVFCKVAMTLDGRTALAGGESRWITSQTARADVHQWRARSSAIMTGIGTVLSDDPALTARPGRSGYDRDSNGSAIEAEELASRQPLRVVIDPRLRITPRARLLHQPGQTLIVTAAEDADKIEALSSAKVRIACFPLVNGMLDLGQIVAYLAHMEVNELLLEAGPGLNGTMLQSGLIDEFIVYMAPRLIGDEGKGPFHMPWVNHMDDLIDLRITEMRAVGEDWRIRAVAAKN